MTASENLVILSPQTAEVFHQYFTRTPHQVSLSSVLGSYWN